MRKIVILVTFLFLLSITGMVFANNPFAIVPSGHWAYDSLEVLVNVGAFDGYNDVHFQKNQTMTRYEMAVLVAKAIANEKKINSEQKPTLDKLSAEFKSELSNLGVFSSNPTASNPAGVSPAVPSAPAADNIKFSGFYRVRYHTLKDNENYGNNMHALYSRIELDSTVKINDKWTGNFAWEAYKNFYTDAGKKNGTMSSAWGADGYNGVNDVTLANVTGPIAGTTMTAGKFNHTFGSGLIFDDYVSGVRFEFGKVLKTKLVYAEADSNIEGNTLPNSYLSKLDRATSLEFNYDLSKKTNVTASLQHWTSKQDDVSSMNVYDFNIVSALNKDLSIYGTYDKTTADDNNRAYVLGLSYKVADKNKPGSYSAFIDYENFQKNTAIDTTYWMFPGQKGVAGGFTYVPAKNVKWTNVVFYGKTLSENNLGPNGTAESKDTTQKYLRTQVFLYF